MYPHILAQMEAVTTETSSLWHGTPISLEAMERVEANGEWIPAIKPKTPRNFNPETGEFEPHSTKPVVCATKVPKAAALRALCHLANHPNVTDGRHGVDELGQLVLTAELYEDVQNQGCALEAYVHQLEQTPDFQKIDGEHDEWRSFDPARIIRTFKLTGEDFPLLGEVVILEPQPLLG